MNTIHRPMLAATLTSDLSIVPYPIFGTPKIDGHRVYRTQGAVYTGRNGKLLQNQHAYTMIDRLLVDDVDGELVVKGEKFSDLSGALRRKDGTPNIHYYLFDWFFSPVTAYAMRKEWLLSNVKFLPSWVEVIIPRIITNETELLQYEIECLDRGFEGVVLRHPNAPYKQGRGTLSTFDMVKWKRFVDDEGTVVGFMEKMHNTNEQTTDPFGLAKRSSHKENLVNANTLGALVVNWHGIEFNIGTGFTEQDRQDIWDSQVDFLGKHVTFKYQQIGTDLRPRTPVFKAFRS